MEILVLNCGSSSLKYALFRYDKEVVRGLIERVGEKVKNHKVAIQMALDKLIQSKKLKCLEDINAIGHRVVHGGDITKSVIIKDDVIKKIEDCVPLAPLHNPHNLTGIKACIELLPNIKQVAVFDTSFHTSIKKEASTYAIPFELSEKHKIKRYGFHGISYRYIVSEIVRILGDEKLKVVCCHLGNGSSVCAIDSCKSRETSMGFTPVEGLVMGTRSGDIDAGIIQYLVKQEKKDVNEVIDMLNFDSGLKGISGISNDMRELDGCKDKNARLAMKVYCHRLIKYIGAYIAVLGGVDVIVFTAGIGENAWYIRDTVLKNFEYLGLEIDKKNNKQNKLFITTPESKVKAMVINTNEELMIARDVLKLVK